MKNLLLLSIFFLGAITTYSQGTFAVGDEIEGNWKGGGKWYAGKIGKVDGEKYFINYNDGDNEWTTANYIRKPGEKKISWPTNTCADKSTKFKVGDKIDIDYNGKWYDGTVLQAKDGQYLVHYDGWSSGYDEIINNDRIQARTKKAAPTGPGSGSGSGSGTSSGSAKTREITLENTCDYEVTMYVNSTEYDLRPGAKKDVQCKDGDEIYYEKKNGSKVILGTVAINGSLWWYHPKCE